MKRYGRKYGRRKLGKRGSLKRRRTFRRRKMARRSLTRIPRTFVLKSANFPLGQRCFAKLPYQQQTFFTGDGVLPLIQTSNFVLNGLAAPPRDGTLDNRAAKFLVNQFSNYQVLGMKYTIDLLEADGSATASAVDPVALFFVPWTSGNEPSVSDGEQFSYMRQFPGFKYRLVNHRFGRSWTKLKGFIKVNTLLGRDVTDDDDWVGTTSGLGTLWNNPTNTISFRWGVMSINETAIPATNFYTGTIKTTFYCKFFNPSIHGTE